MFSTCLNHTPNPTAALLTEKSHVDESPLWRGFGRGFHCSPLTHKKGDSSIASRVPDKFRLSLLRTADGNQS